MNHPHSQPPLITQTVHLSLQTGTVPSALKVSVIQNFVKKPNLDPEVPASYRPITQPPFLVQGLGEGGCFLALGPL